MQLPVTFKSIREKELNDKERSLLIIKKILLQNSKVYRNQNILLRDY